jgi:hypothetical protein
MSSNDYEDSSYGLNLEDSRSISKIKEFLEVPRTHLRNEILCQL